MRKRQHLQPELFWNWRSRASGVRLTRNLQKRVRVNGEKIVYLARQLIIRIMKGVFYFVLILLAVAGICIVTCPDREAHTAAMKDMVNNYITKDLSHNITTEEAGLAALGSVTYRLSGRPQSRLYAER